MNAAAGTNPPPRSNATDTTTTGPTIHGLDAVDSTTQQPGAGSTAALPIKLTPSVLVLQDAYFDMVVPRMSGGVPPYTVRIYGVWVVNPSGLGLFCPFLHHAPGLVCMLSAFPRSK